jgi:uroporphyrinogen-III decarboxylase
MFEKVDIARAKKVLGDTACICGNFPTTDLSFGSKESVIEDTKRMLDICAPGGGFIMNCSIVLDNYKEELFDAWYETTMKYGAY